MSTLGGPLPYLPGLTSISLGALMLVVITCLIVEVLAGVLTWRASRVSRLEASMIERRRTLRAGVAKTNYTSTFVENSKLKRLLLKVEKDIEQYQLEKAKRGKATAAVVRSLMWGVYGSLVVVMWGHPLIHFSPEYLFPSTRMHAFSGGGEAGCVGALSIIAMFRFGLAPRFSPTG